MMWAPILGMMAGVDGPLSFPAIVVFALMAAIALVSLYPFQTRNHGFFTLFPPERVSDSR